jgi:Homeodomain-like domain
VGPAVEGSDVGRALSYYGSMRYAQCGGYTPVEQQRRERVRLGAAERFARGDSVAEIAAEWRVTERTVRRWRQAWRQGGTVAQRQEV